MEPLQPTPYAQLPLRVKNDIHLIEAYGKTYRELHKLVQPLLVQSGLHQSWVVRLLFSLATDTAHDQTGLNDLDFSFQCQLEARAKALGLLPATPPESKS